MTNNQIKLFCSGRFYFDCCDTDYITKASLDYRAKLLGDVNKLLYPQTAYEVNGRVQYIGPFYYECEDMKAQNVVSSECRMIRECTHAVFILDKADAPGSIAELIYAASLQKNIYIFYIELSKEMETESELHTPNWYPILMCKQLNPKTTLIACRSVTEAENLAIQTIGML